MQVMMTKSLALASSEFVSELASSEVPVIWMVFIHFHSFPGDPTETWSETPSITMDPSLQLYEVLTDTLMPPCLWLSSLFQHGKCQIWAPLLLY